MKKFEFGLLAMACVFTFSLVSCSDDDDYKPEAVVEEALKAKYPSATRIEWEQKGSYLVADCMVESKDIDAWFTSSGQWTMTEIDLLKSDIPAAVNTTLSASEYAAWVIDDVDLLEYPLKEKEYVIEVEQGAQEMDLYFSEAGVLLRTKDVSTGDDTHWPE